MAGCSILAALAGAQPAAAITPPRGVQPLRNDDSRTPGRAAVPATARRARAKLEDRLGTGGVVTADRITGTPRLVARTDGFLTSASGGDPIDIAFGYLRAHRDVFGLDDADLAAMRLTSRYRSPDGVTHLAFIQTVDGVAAYDNVLLANVTQDGRLVNIGGSAVHDLDVGSIAPDITASRAAGAARSDVRGSLTAPAARQLPGRERPTRFANGDSARLTLLRDGTTTRLAWRVAVTGERGLGYEMVVDASSGEVLLRRSLTDFASEANVHDDYPGAPGSATHTVDLAADPTWLDRSQGHTMLRGNNAHAYADTGGGDGLDPGEDVAASSQTDWIYPQTLFDVSGSPCPRVDDVPACTWSGYDHESKATNRNQATTQLFYLVNRFHDHLEAAPIGFTHASRNFEFADADGPGGSGLGGDPLRAESNDWSGGDNANMYTPADGSPPRMQMYHWTQPPTNSSDAADVVYHEYTHGLTNRLVGNGSGLVAAQSRAMGEAWSDWYGLDFLVASGDRPDTAAAGELTVAAYLRPGGIRRQPIDCPVGSTASRCPGTPTAGPGGYTLGDMGKVLSGFQFHADGEIWSQTLWDLRTAVGSTAARALVTGALRLSPDNPSFLEMRDAIIQADAVLGGTRYDTLWQVFAKRGMGYSAYTGNAGDIRAQEAFDLPPVLLHEAATVTDPAPGGDGDDVAEPGETIQINERLRNSNPGTITGIAGVLRSSTPGVRVTQPNASWPNIASGTTAAGGPDFNVAIPSALTCGATIDLSLAVTATQGTIAVPIQVPVGLGALSDSGDVPKTIRTSGSESVLRFSGHGTVDGLRVRIGKLTHSYVGNIELTLRSPAGTSVTLTRSPGEGYYGSGGDDFTDLIFSDDAESAIEGIPSQGPPGGYTGSYRPDEPLSAFDGEDHYGTWTLRVRDIHPYDEQQMLQAWGIAPVGVECSTDGNDAPIGKSDAYSVAFNGALDGATVLANDTDADGDSLTAVKVTDPKHGSVALAADGTFTYTPEKGYSGPDAFQYRAHDGSVTSAATTVNITVKQPNKAPFSTADYHYLDEDETYTGASVLGNEADPDGDPLTAVKVYDPLHGSLELAPDGTFTYTPDANFWGSDTFVYRASDGAAESPSAVVYLTVAEVNDVPVAAADAYSVPLTAPAARGDAWMGASLLANDTDAENSALRVQVEREPTLGSVAVNGDGRFAYSPRARGVALVDTFTYRAADQASASEPVLVIVQIRPAIVAPSPFPITPTIVPTREAAALEVQRARVSGGKLRLDARVSRLASGSIKVRYRSAQKTTTFSAPISGGRARVKKSLPATQRSRKTGAVTLTYDGNALTLPEKVTLRAAPAAAGLKRTASSIDSQGRLRVAGKIARRARGSVRVRMSYSALDGVVTDLVFSAKIKQGAWKLVKALPAAAAQAGGRLSITYKGAGGAGLRGEQVSKAIAPKT